MGRVDRDYRTLDRAVRAAALEPAYRLAGYRSGKKSRPLTISAMFLSAPTNGTALRPVSIVPLTTPLRRTVDTTVATAIAVPTIGIERRSLRDNRAPPHLVNRFPIVMPGYCAIIRARYCRARGLHNSPA